MLRHDSVWAAIDALASRYDLSASALAKKAGLDPTTFNRSKRLGNDGRPRWPSTESIAKVMEATGSTLSDFVNLVENTVIAPEMKSAAIAQSPLLGYAQAGGGGFFEDAGFAPGDGWEQVGFPGTATGSTFALQVSGDSMLPLYREGDTIIVDQEAVVRTGDRVVVRTRTGEVMAKVLQRMNDKSILLASLNPDHPDVFLDQGDVEWVARIIWASQ
jgi:phage repressor protein C with HTH and peptisase S24 domain